MHIETLAKWVAESNRIVFFGGAGVSTESGIKDYRSKDGIYNTVRDYGVSPEMILSHSFFYEKPDVFYDFYRRFFLSDAEPNDAHKALAELEKAGKLSSVITQNIDELHQKAGSKTVIELHGTTAVFSCTKCHHKTDGIVETETIANGNLPLCPLCGGLLRPEVVLYEEPLHDGVADRAITEIANADMLIVGGTSLAVYPAASFLQYFSGKHLVLINKSETPLDQKADLTIHDSIGKVMRAVMEHPEVGLW